MIGEECHEETEVFGYNQLVKLLLTDKAKHEKEI